jgi:hypothetical protein
MRLVEKSQKIIKTFEIDYENEIKCEFTTTNGKLTNYNFSKGSVNLTYVESIDELVNLHWSEHYKVIAKQKKLTITQIKKFDDFDKLFYVGGHIDGMTADKDGNFISTPIILDQVFSACFLRIETKKEKCQKIIDSLNKEFVIDYKIVEIPGYNWSESKKHHYTLHLIVKLTDELYNKFLNNEKKYLDDTIKVNIFEFLKNK